MRALPENAMVALVRMKAARSRWAGPGTPLVLAAVALAAPVLLAGDLLPLVGMGLGYACLAGPVMICAEVQKLRRRGGTSELLAAGTTPEEIGDPLGAEAARWSAASVGFTVLPFSVSLGLAGVLSPEGALFLLAAAALALPLIGATTAWMALVDRAADDGRSRAARTLAGLLIWICWMAPWAGTLLFGLPYPALFLLLFPLYPLWVRARALRSLAASRSTSPQGSQAAPAEWQGWSSKPSAWERSLGTSPTRGDVLASVASRGLSLLKRPALAAFPALAVAASAAILGGLLAWRGIDGTLRGVEALALAGLASLALGLVGFHAVYTEVCREWDGSTMSTLWPTSLTARHAVDGWAALWALPGLAGGLLGAPLLLLVGVADGLPAPVALGAAVLPALVAPLAAWLAVWCAPEGSLVRALRLLVAGILLVGTTGSLVGGLSLHLLARPEATALLVVGAALLAGLPVLFRELALQALAQRPGHPGFSPPG